MRPAPFYGWVVLGAAFAIFIACIGMGLGSVAGGAIHDALGSYQGLFLGSFAVGAMAALLGGTLQAPGLATAPRTA